MTRRPIQIGRFAEQLAAGNERLEDDVAETGALIQDLAEGVAGDFEDFAVAAGDGCKDEREGCR